MIIRICFLAALGAATGTGSLAQSISIDQAGYLPSLPKYAFSSAVADSFHIVDAATLAERYKGPLTLWKSNDAATGKTVRKGDFSLFQESGTYRVVTAPGDTSEAFGIGDTIDNGVYRKALKGFYFQRCGTTLSSPSAGLYIHPACHTQDGTYHSTAGSTGYRRTDGGWHDAGDYGKYVVNAGVTVGTMLMGYEYFPAKFEQDDLGIPESGNGLPDLLDEVQYELEWLLKMQRSDGGVYFKVTRTNFSGFIMPQSDTDTRYIYQVSSTATGDFAAMMARASRVYRPFDNAFADTCLNAAILAWSYLSANSSIVPAGGFKNPPGTATGQYGDGSDTDERLWAAAELFAATGGSEYQSAYELYASSNGYFGSTMSWPDVGTMAHLTYLKTTQPSTDETLRGQLKTALNSFCASALARRNASGYHVTLQNYWWGSNAEALNTAVLMIMGFEATGTVAYRDAAADQLHYVLGANGLRHSFLTGVGTRSTRHPHHRPSESDGIADPVPGLLSGGPDQGLDDAVLQARFSPSTPPALCYVDTMPSYASNEIAINWNAPLVFVAGYFSATAVTSVPQHGGTLMPRNIRLEQNYPNPFNPTTIVSYQVPGLCNVKLSIYDALGREIASLVDEMKKPGSYSIIWNASRVASGSYFARLTAGGSSQCIRLVVLR